MKKRIIAMILGASMLITFSDGMEYLAAIRSSEELSKNMMKTIQYGYLLRLFLLDL